MKAAKIKLLPAVFKVHTTLLYKECALVCTVTMVLKLGHYCVVCSVHTSAQCEVFTPE